LLRQDPLKKTKTSLERERKWSSPQIYALRLVNFFNGFLDIHWKKLPDVNTTRLRTENNKLYLFSDVDKEELCKAIDFEIHFQNTAEETRGLRDFSNGTSLLPQNISIEITDESGQKTFFTEISKVTTGYDFDFSNDKFVCSHFAVVSLITFPFISLILLLNIYTTLSALQEGIIVQVVRPGRSKLAILETEEKEISQKKVVPLSTEYVEPIPGPSRETTQMRTLIPLSERKIHSD
jgi:hypothetical protein